MEMEQVKKVVRLNENPKGNEEEVKVDGGRDEDELSDMDKLPPEILLKILDYLDEQDLVKCRLVNSRWNEISCLLLQEKTKKNHRSQLIVHLTSNMECRTVITKSFEEFLKCFSPSQVEKSSDSDRRRPFPFSRFHVIRLKYMDVAQTCEFVSTFGPRMKTVFVDVSPEEALNFQRFWRLLLHFAPNISHFGIRGGYYLEDVSVVDPITKFIAETDPNVKVLAPKDTFLKNLKVLEINSHDFCPRGFLKELLNNTPNLEEVSSFKLYSSRSDDLKDLEVWQQLNKAHLLKKLEIRSNSRSDSSPAELMKNLQLESLLADCSLHYKYVESENAFTNVVYHAMKSSQTALSSLVLWNLNRKCMNLCFKDIKSLPNVRRLQIQVQYSTEAENVLEPFSQLCPNVTGLFLYSLNRDFSKVARILWTKFRGLKTLQLIFYLADGKIIPLILDSEFSGYSTESIERFQSKLELEEGISLEEARQGEPQNPSIFDLKNLSRLQLQFFMGNKTSEQEQLENQLRNSVFMKMLPEHIRGNRTPLIFRYPPYYTNFFSQ